MHTNIKCISSSIRLELQILHILSSRGRIFNLPILSLIRSYRPLSIRREWLLNLNFDRRTRFSLFKVIKYFSNSNRFLYLKYKSSLPCLSVEYFIFMSFHVSKKFFLTYFFRRDLNFPFDSLLHISKSKPSLLLKNIMFAYQELFVVLQLLYSFNALSNKFDYIPRNFCWRGIKILQPVFSKL